MADASALGIHPPSTVRIVMGDGWTQDWPWHCVDINGEEVVVSVELTHGRRRVIFYPYEHAHQLKPRMLASTWAFHGRESFIVKAGPPQPMSDQ